MSPRPTSIEKRREACPNRDNHHPMPDDYLTWHEWAENKAKTHTQHKCPGCGLYLILKEKP